MIVSVTVIPAAACWLLKSQKTASSWSTRPRSAHQVCLDLFAFVMDQRGFCSSDATPDVRAGSWFWRLALFVAFVSGRSGAAFFFLPATEYLPTGNRNLIIAILLPPPGYNIDKMIELGEH